MPLGMEVGLGSGHIVLYVNPTRLPIKGLHVCCDQTAGWIQMPALGTTVGLGPGNTVLDADP